MKNQKIVSIVMLSLYMTQCSPSKKEDVLLTNAAQLHNEAVALASLLDQQLDTLENDISYLKDSVIAWRTALEKWEGNVVEVPGNESLEHDHADHGHNHEKAVELTPEQMFSIQQEMKAQIEKLQRRINAPIKNDEPF